MLGSPADAADAAAAAAACPSAADARYARAAALDRAGRRLDATRALCFGANATAALLVDVAPWERRRGNVPSAATALRAFALMRTCGVAAIPGFDVGAVAAAVDERWDREGAPAAAAAAAAPAAAPHLETETVAARDRETPPRRFELRLPALEAPFRRLVVDDLLVFFAKLFVAGNAIAVDTCSVVMSLPRCGAGHWHQDVEDPFQYGHAISGAPVAPPPPAVVAAIPAVDVGAGNGPTAFLLGSHAQPGHERDWWRDAQGRGDARGFEVAPAAARGTAFFFDVRLRHRGGPNPSRHRRPLLYVGYAQRWFRDAANFRAPRARAWGAEASRAERALLDRHGAAAYVAAVEAALGDAAADARLDDAAAARLREADSAKFYAV